MLSTNSEVKHSSFVRTIPLVAIYVIIIALDEAQIFSDIFQPDISFLFLQSVMFLFFIISYILLRYEHRRLKTNGYAVFASSVSLIAKLTPGCCAICTLVIGCLTVFSPPSIGSFPLRYLMQIIVSLQNILALVFSIIYLQRCISHSLSENMPDSQMWENLPAGLANANLQGSPVTASVLASTRNLRRSQTREIGLLEETVAKRNQEVHRLRENNAMHGVGSPEWNDPNTHLLAIKEQELRALSQERDNISRDLRVAIERCEELQKYVSQLQAEANNSSQDLLTAEQNYKHSEEEQERLALLLNVEQEANATAQQTIDQLRGTVDQISKDAI